MCCPVACSGVLVQGHSAKFYASHGKTQRGIASHASGSGAFALTCEMFTAAAGGHGFCMVEKDGSSGCKARLQLKASMSQRCDIIPVSLPVTVFV